jgi:iron(III) transport system substrate-binding protein
MKKLAFVLLLLCAGGLVMLGAQARVVAYTAHEDNIIAGMVPRFKDETGMDLEFVKLASGDVIKRVVAEAANPQCDVIWSIGGEQLEANSAVLEKYIPKEWTKIDSVFKVGTNWLPYTGIMNVLIVNTQLVPAARMPKGWADLTDPWWKGKVS